MIVSVLRYAGDIYTELILRFAKSINNNATTLFKAKLSPYATGAGKKANGNSSKENEQEEEHEELDTEPKKLEWHLTPELRTGIRFAETRLSDLICQNDIVTLEFDVSCLFLDNLSICRFGVFHRFVSMWLMLCVLCFAFALFFQTLHPNSPTENLSSQDMVTHPMPSYRWLSKQPISHFMDVQNARMSQP